MAEVFAELLRRLRKQAGFTQKQLAERSGMSESLISKLERDKKNGKASTEIRSTTLKMLANGLGLADPDRGLLFDVAWEREKQKREEKRGIVPLMIPIAGENPEANILLSGSYDLSKHLVLTRMEDVAEFVISMLNKAGKKNLNKDSTQEILVTTLGSSSIFRHLGKEDLWNQAIRSVMKDHKWNVVGLYRMTGDLNRAFEVIQEIRNLSIYPSQFIPRSFRRIGEIRPCYNMLIIPGIGALWALSTHNPAVIDAAFFYPDTREFEQHIRLLNDHFNLLFTETVQLARTYENRSAEWDDTMTRVCQLEADEFLANNSIDASTMPPALYDEFLEKSLRRQNIYSPMEFRRLKAHHMQRREAFERYVQSFTYRTIMPWHAFEDALGLSPETDECRYLVPYASGPDAPYITVDKNQAIQHIKHLIDELERYDNYEIALIKDHPYVEDLLYTPWLVKGEIAVLTAIFTKGDDGGQPVFAAEFEITESSLVRSYRQQFLTVWEEVTDKNKEEYKEHVIRELRELLNRAGEK